MKILGIDPGTTRIGFGVVEERSGKLSPGTFGCLFFEDHPQEERLRALYEAIQNILAKEKPEAVGIERVFFSKNRKTALAVSEARGVVRLAIQQADIPIHEYTPSQVKQAVSAHGGAGKQAVEKMVQLLLGISKPIRQDDAVDALAVAICCAHSVRMERAV